MEQMIQEFTTSQKKALKVIITNQEDIKEEIKILKSTVKENNLQHFSYNETTLPTLPINTDEELSTLEKIINDCQDERSNLIMIFSLIGGDELAVVVRHIMKKLFSKSMALKYSLKGKGRLNKKSFKDLHVYSCVIGK
jgi:uncharacterized protein YrzB (UPF0473 family)